MDTMFVNSAAIVTGAASGIGYHTALLLLERGAHVVAVDIDASVDSKFTDYREHVASVVGDTTNPSTAVKACEVAASFGVPLKILVSNSGYIVPKSIEDISVTDWDRVLDINLGSYFQMARNVIPILRKNGGGAVVATASISGVLGLRQQAAYCASKGGVVQLTRQMAVEYGADNIRVNAVGPGAVDTPFLWRSLQDLDDPNAALEEIQASYPLGRIAQPDEVARAIVFLASPDASFISGQILMVDGGYSSE